MNEAEVSPEGVVTIPYAIRKELGVEHGGKIEFIRDLDGIIVLVGRNISLDVIKGILPRPEIDGSVEELVGLGIKRAMLDQK
ncbi:AbrB family transcriptional regulator [Duganella sp. CY15W]|uniref:AbrB/MazE/SpoVT family DNA-binding domain-containing protein n=1 Tax=Duganella sp. CY15W TaxID=2692172 RepID=UPI00136C4809|nr:AbrB family transcriptional regulator [Duganella sp. CY15W]MYM29673.1 AbrB family transcriptional regulator [Duganella sp. CY15W]